MYFTHVTPSDLEQQTPYTKMSTNDESSPLPSASASAVTNDASKSVSVSPPMTSTDQANKYYSSTKALVPQGSSSSMISFTAADSNSGSGTGGEGQEGAAGAGAAAGSGSGSAGEAKRRNDLLQKNDSTLMNVLNKITTKKDESLTANYEDFDSSSKAIKIALFVIIVYLVIGTVVFDQWVDGWTGIDAVYFTVATFTTVGYGDLYPETEAQRIFGMFFVTGGIMIIGGVVLGVLFDAFFEKFEASSKETTDDLAEKFIANCSQNHGHGHGREGNKSSASSEDTNAELEEKKSLEKIYWSAVIVGLIFAPALVIGHFEGWSVAESAYYAIITATTVGYGDLSPQLPGTRLAAVFYLPLCVCTMAKIFDMVTSVYMNSKAAETEKNFLDRQLTLEDLKKMDKDGDNKVDREEFLIFMLVAMEKTDKATIDKILELFERWDADADNGLEPSDILKRAYGKGVKDQDHEGKSVDWV